MSNNVTFNEESQITYRPSYAATQKQSSIVGLMYKLGVAKTEKDANVVMAGIILVCVIVTGTMFAFVQPHPNAEQQAALQRDLERMNAQASASAGQSQ